MTLCNLQFSCTKQVLTRTDTLKVAEYAAHSIGVTFTLCNTWNGLTVYARFASDWLSYDVPFGTGNCVTIPHEVIKAPSFDVSIYGLDGEGMKFTSNKVTIEVAESIGGAAIDPLPQSQTLIERLEEEIEEASESAVWGSVTGTLSDQDDIQNALDAKQDALTAGDGIEISGGIIRNTGVTNIAVNANGSMVIWKGQPTV